MIKVFPKIIQYGDTSTVIFEGFPDEPIIWSVEGAATLSHFSAKTDSRGFARATLTPSEPDQTITVKVRYGA